MVTAVVTGMTGTEDSATPVEGQETSYAFNYSFIAQFAVFYSFHKYLILYFFVMLGDRAVMAFQMFSVYQEEETVS